MSEFTRRRTQSGKFIGIRLDENDIARLASILHGLAGRVGGSVEIRIVSGSGEDTITTQDPDFFNSPEMPRIVRSISLSCGRYGGPIYCRIDLEAEKSGGAKVQAEGTDTNVVSGVFHELEGELSARRSAFRWLSVPFPDRGFPQMLIYLALLALLSGTAAYSLLDLPLDLASRWIVGFKESATHHALQKIGGWIVGAALVGGPFLVTEFVERTFLPVQFAGRLSDSGAIWRSRVIWVATAIFLPIVLNVASNFLTRPRFP